MTELAWSQSPDDAAGQGGEIILAQAETPAELSPTGPLVPTGPLDPTALEQAPAVTLPRELVEMETAIDAAEGEAAAGPAAEAGSVSEATTGTTPEAAATTAEAAPGTPAAPPGEIEVAAPLPGERRVIEVPAGALVSLDDSAFDPDSATYVVSGNDLIVTLANGSVVVLTGFFAPSETPAQLSVLGGPPSTPVQLLARAEEMPDMDGPPEIEPAAGVIVGGASAFREYDQGNIGDGLDPLGPLGPTALAYALDTPELTAIEFIDDGRQDDTPPGPPQSSAPTVTVRAPFDGTIGEQPGPGFNPVTTPILPLPEGGGRVPDAQINNIDQRNLTLDADREVFIRFLDETSVSVDTLLVHDIDAEGRIVNVRTVFPGTNKAGDVGPVLNTEPGHEVSLGVVPAGTQFAFILVNHGYEGRPTSIWESGRLEVRHPTSGEISKITDGSTTDPSSVPILVHIDENNNETVINERLVFSADASQGTTNSNRLNADGEGHYVSGWDDEAGMLVVGVEDRWGANAESVPSRVKDNDFNDLVFGVRFGSTEESVLVTEGGRGLGVTISDDDSTEMASATIVLTGFAGDRLVIDPAAVASIASDLNQGGGNSDGGKNSGGSIGAIDGPPSGGRSGIVISQVSDTEIQLDGLSSIENYEKVISAITIEVDLENPIHGPREVTVTVEDPEGNEGSSSTTFTVQDNLIAGTPGDDVLTGTPGDDVIAGRGGDDQIDGRGGNDFVSGGDGRDTIDVSLPGENIVIGGLQPDTIILGPGADTVRFFGLSDGTDTIRNFDATEGDRLDLSVLLRDSGITDANFDAFVRTQDVAGGVKVQVDLDGPGANTRFVDVAILENPTGVIGTDPSTFVITPADDAAVV